VLVGNVVWMGRLTLFTDFGYAPGGDTGVRDGRGDPEFLNTVWDAAESCRATA
jgi:hypothetical protein